MSGRREGGRRGATLIEIIGNWSRMTAWTRFSIVTDSGWNATDDQNANGDPSWIVRNKNPAMLAGRSVLKFYPYRA
jgi:hypothetical protein